VPSELPGLNVRQMSLVEMVLESNVVYCDQDVYFSLHLQYENIIYVAYKTISAINLNSFSTGLAFYRPSVHE
jgi:hypothetical protein